MLQANSAKRYQLAILDLNPIVCYRPRVILSVLVVTFQCYATVQCYGQGAYAIGADFRAVSRPEATDPVIGAITVPDSMGSVGPEHVMVLLNGRYEMYQKSGLPTNGMDATPIINAEGGLHDFWNVVAGVSITPSYAAFDPRLAYDPSTKRWYAVSGEFVPGQPGADILFARSRSADPTAGWDGVRIPSLDGGNPFLVDMPTIGFDESFVYVSLNDDMDDNSVVALPKDDILQTMPTIANRRQFALSLGTPNLASYVTQAFDGLGRNSQPFHIWNSPTGNLLQFNRIVQDGADIAINAADPPDSIQFTTDAATGVNAGRQPSGNGLSVFGDLMSAPVRIGGSYWGVLSRTSGNDDVVYWFQIDAASETLQDSGKIAIPNQDLIYPSISVNPRGDVVIGFTATGPNQYPSAYAAVRPSDSANFSVPAMLRAGTASYDSGLAAPYQWGDYSSTVFDPADPNIFWTFQEWASGSPTVDDEWSVQATEIIVFQDDEFYWRDTTSGSLTDSGRWLGDKGAPAATDHVVFSRSGAYAAEMTTDQTNQSVGVRQGDVYLGFNYSVNGKTYTVNDSIKVGEFQGPSRLTLYSSTLPFIPNVNTVKTDRVEIGSQGEVRLYNDFIKLESLTGAELPTIEIALGDDDESGIIVFNSASDIEIPDFDFVFSDGYDPQLGDEFTILRNEGTGELVGFAGAVSRLLGDRYIKVNGEAVLGEPVPEFEITMPLVPGTGQQLLSSTSPKKLRAGLVMSEDESELILRVSYLADFDLDWDVDGEDLTAFAAQWSLTGMANCYADFDGDGDVDGLDLTTFSSQFGEPFEEGGPAPEPTTAALFGMATVCLVSGVGRRRSS